MTCPGALPPHLPSPPASGRPSGMLGGLAVSPGAVAQLRAPPGCPRSPWVVPAGMLRAKKGVGACRTVLCRLRCGFGLSSVPQPGLGGWRCELTAVESLSWRLCRAARARFGKTRWGVANQQLSVVPGCAPTLSSPRLLNKACNLHLAEEVPVNFKRTFNTASESFRNEN